ncbi:hypothetical protein PZB74_19270 [Porifericola rhodea]|nr:hypothetical protein [Porifericola rhodea]WKN31094.1 hypothetical protein PZB74_19270 [Porifericola rhodea]
MENKAIYHDKLENERYGRPQNIRVLVSNYLMELRASNTDKKQLQATAG